MFSGSQSPGRRDATYSFLLIFLTVSVDVPSGDQQTIIATIILRKIPIEGGAPPLARPAIHSFIYSANQPILVSVVFIISRVHSQPLPRHTMTVLSKPLAYLTTTSLGVLTLLTGTLTAISHSTTASLRKARFVIHLGCYVGALAVCSWLGVVYSVLLTIVGQVRPFFSLWVTAADERMGRDSTSTTLPHGRSTTFARL